MTTTRMAPPTYTAETWAADTTISHLSNPHTAAGERLLLYVCVNDDTGALLHAEYSARPDHLADFIHHAIAVQGQRVPSRLVMDQGNQRWAAEFAPLDMIQISREGYGARHIGPLCRCAQLITSKFELPLAGRQESSVIRFDLNDINMMLLAWLREHAYLFAVHTVPTSAPEPAVAVSLPRGEGCPPQAGGVGRPPCRPTCLRGWP